MFRFILITILLISAAEKLALLLVELFRIPCFMERMSTAMTLCDELLGFAERPALTDRRLDELIRFRVVRLHLFAVPFNLALETQGQSS